MLDIQAGSLVVPDVVLGGMHSLTLARTGAEVWTDS
jgi:hypothetical protein